MRKGDKAKLDKAKCREKEKKRNYVIQEGKANTQIIITTIFAKVASSCFTADRISIRELGRGSGRFLSNTHMVQL